jgi:hypothetical protein
VGEKDRARPMKREEWINACATGCEKDGAIGTDVD